MNIRYMNIGLYMAAFVALVDQFSKAFILHSLIATNPPVQIVNPFINFVLNWNKGITFGILNHNEAWTSYAFIALAVVILLLLLDWLYRSTSLLMALALGLVIGGAIGNVIDRVRHGAVVDFIDFHVMGYHWYTFNLADSAIVCGVGLLLIEHLVTSMKKR
jgi:signal peptidase II